MRRLSASGSYGFPRRAAHRFFRRGPSRSISAMTVSRSIAAMSASSSLWLGVPLESPDGAREVSIMWPTIPYRYLHSGDGSAQKEPAGTERVMGDGRTPRASWLFLLPGGRRPMSSGGARASGFSHHLIGRRGNGGGGQRLPNSGSQASKSFQNRAKHGKCRTLLVAHHGARLGDHTLTVVEVHYWPLPGIQGQLRGLLRLAQRWHTVKHGGGGVVHRLASNTGEGSSLA